MCFIQEVVISTLNGSSLKLEGKFMHLGSSVSSIESDIKMHLAKAWTVIDRLLIIWKSDQSNKIKRNFFQVAVVSILPHGCTTWTLTKSIEKRWTETAQECCELYWINPGSNIPRNSSRTATCLLPQKPSK